MSKRANRIAWGLVLGGPILVLGVFVVWQWLVAREQQREQEAELAVLTPPGAQLLTRSEDEQGCEWHVVRKLRSTRAAVEAWAASLRLSCYAPDPLSTKPVPCARWRSESPPVEVELNETTVVIDSRHGYLCGGPFR